jgi:type I restriction enzyme R subunit
VAFSGEVIDPESGPDPFTEHSRSLNPNLKGRDIREAFKGGEYQLLLAANKFQTGFDQPLLCGMYVDKRLAGIQAVQTLSRLNRAHPGKDTTYVVDFVNDPAEVLAAFQAYHSTAELSATTDPHLVFNLRAKLDASGHYHDFEVERVVAVELDHREALDLLQAAAPAAGIRARAGGHRPLEGEAHSLQLEGAGGRADGARRGGGPEARPAQRGRQRQRAGAGEGGLAGDHRAAEPALQREAHRR